MKVRDIFRFIAWLFFATLIDVAFSRLGGWPLNTPAENMIFPMMVTIITAIREERP